MTPLDTELFNEFKRLDKLLRESRGTERGVSDYIDEMKEILSYESQSIPNWDLDLDRLWYCRHIRNKLAHDTTSEEYPLCDPENVAFLQNFYARVLKSEDPLAQLRRYRQEKARQEKARKTQTRPTAPQFHTTQPQLHTYTQSGRTMAPQNQGCLSCVIWTAVTVLAVPCVMAIIRLLTQ